ncbi:homoserine dehydrogenase [Candidatus Carsonella ruddii CS isolate Thao2000]|uniref:homoserine dehydrogenase n=1 Tax=Candidatus Carsonella ruddii CS isolate Thao2000 TaxID=1202537 RepID=J7GTD7_CARRU|nr:homoserine dehydrogenase [Candidatus Carsonella ruddii]AFP83794.1 homoserine dehydrogenase [Candidatus Carsonella ruddii CS isolate Thao2000]
MKINIFGLGNVGSGSFFYFKNKKNIITFSRKNRFKCVLKKNFKNYIFLFKKNRFFIELIGSINVCFEIILNCLKNKNNYITANKEIISKYFFFINFLFKINNKKIYFEASVGGSMPIIKNLKNFYFTEKKLYFLSILNGTNNFILTNIKKYNFNKLIKIAINKGYAEQNFKNDILGLDTLYKSTIIISIIKNFFLNKFIINLESIFSLNLFFRLTLYKKIYIFFFLKIKKYNFFCINLFFTKNFFFYKTKNSLNCFFFNCLNSKKSFFVSPGAGSEETTSSIISDYFSSLKKKLFLKSFCNNYIKNINFKFTSYNYIYFFYKKINNIYFIIKNKIKILKYFLYKKNVIIKTKKTLFKKVLEFLYFIKNENFNLYKIL